MTATAPTTTPTPAPTHPLAIVPVDPATSALRAQPFDERLDRRRLDRLVRHVEAHREDAAANPTYTPTSPKFGHADGLAHLRALARKAKRDGALHVTHKPPGRGRKHDLARVYAVGGLSLACLKRGYRGYLANPAYVDVDLKNAQPTLLRHACAAAGLVTPCLDEYADRCDEVRARIAAATGCTPAQAKNLPIRLLNQGTVAGWRRQYGLPADQPEPPWAAAFAAEVRAVADAVTEANPGVRTTTYNRLVKENGGIAPTPVALRKKLLHTLLENLERRLVEHVLHAMPAEARRSAVYCYDGLMVERRFFAEGGCDLAWFDAATATSLCPAARWEVKPLPALEVPEPPPPLAVDALPHDRLDVERMARLRTYDERKRYWERYVCVVETSMTFYRVQKYVDEDGQYRRQMVAVTKATLLAQYNNVKTDLEAQERWRDDRRNEHDFVKTWLRDVGRRAYDNAHFVPYNGAYDAARTPHPTCFNTFMGYPDAVGDAALDTEAPDVARAFAMFLDVGRECVGGEENWEVFAQLLAQKVCDPTKKNPYVPVLRGRQGEGKDFLVSAFEAVVGAQHVLRCNDASTLGKLGGTGQMEGKLLVQINEAEARQTHQLQGAIKSWGTDTKVVVRKLYENPKTANVYALWCCTSNKLYIVSMDTDTGERRFFVMEGTGKYSPACGTPLHPAVWEALWRMLRQPAFVKRLYDWFNAIYDPAYDFQAAKARNAQTPAYKKVVGAQRRDELFWLQALLESKGWVRLVRQSGGAAAADATAAADADADPLLANPPVTGADADTTAPFFAATSWARTVHVPEHALHEDFKHWATAHDHAHGSTRKRKDFVSNLTHVLSLPFAEAQRPDGERVLSFEPQALYYALYKTYMMEPDPRTVEALVVMDGRERTTVVPAAFAAECGGGEGA
jgi:hypothetical protein